MHELGGSTKEYLLETRTSSRTSVNRSEGRIYVDEEGVEHLFGISLPLPQLRFDWLGATLAQSQNCLSKIEVAVAYTLDEFVKSSNSRDISTSTASFTFCTGEYFKVK